MDVKTTHPPGHVDIEAARAAGIIWGNLARPIWARDASPAAFTESLHPVYVEVWGRKVLTHISTDRINQAAGRLRNSPIPEKEYERL